MSKIHARTEQIAGKLGFRNYLFSIEDTNPKKSKNADEELDLRIARKLPVQSDRT